MPGYLKIVVPESGTSMDAKVITPSGEVCSGICGIDISMRPNEFVSAKIELLAEIEIFAAKQSLFIMHPVTGKMEEVAEIRFADGSTLSEIK